VRSLSSGKTKSDFDPCGPSALVSRAVLGIDHHPHDGTGYIGRLINSAAWVALSAGHARMLLAWLHPNDSQNVRFRALQAENDDFEKVGLALLYPASHDGVSVKR
jgi:hypothetical protein